ncbi:LytR C-terminal domain-containing protein [Tersicoccus sp. MR15.9]|uniref:LytR C-terminal domain-containing protein n=1 Tax=Tersicoccus mangrovi TaxID=3121635 RepID=UPI002FE54E6B
MARRPIDPLDLHGLHIVTNEELARTLQADEADRERFRHRRRLLHGLVLIFALVVLASALVLVLAMVQGYRPFPAPARTAVATAKPTPTVNAAGCPTVPVVPAAANRVQVDVLNATSTPGLAGSVAARLRERGMVITGIGNRTVADPAAVTVVAGRAGRSAALAVQRQLPGSVYREDARTGTAVDLVLGTGFKQVADARSVDTTRPGRLRCGK